MVAAVDGLYTRVPVSRNVTAVTRLCSPLYIPAQTQQKPAEDGQLIFLTAGDQAVKIYTPLWLGGERGVGMGGYFICFGCVQVLPMHI